MWGFRVEIKGNRLPHYFEIVALVMTGKLSKISFQALLLVTGLEIFPRFCIGKNVVIGEEFRELLFKPGVRMVL